MKDKLHSRFPNPRLFNNIKLLWEILEIVVGDWRREVTPLQETVNSSISETEKLFHTTNAFNSLQPYYLKCLFSYAVFFVALKGAYHKFYEQLNTLTQKTFLRVEHDKEPKPTAYIKKVEMIRNISIAHIGSERKGKANSLSSMDWQPMTLSPEINGSWDLSTMTFGGMRLTLKDEKGNVIERADDLEIKGIPELDEKCRQYLDMYDRICSDYLRRIHAKLPMTVGEEKYFEFKVLI